MMKNPDNRLGLPRLFSDLEALSRAAAERLVQVIDAVLAKQDRFVLALAGGGTPQRLYELLAGSYRDRIPWNRILVFWGDERYVLSDHPASNYHAAYNALIRHVPLLPGQVFPIPTHAPTPEEAADSYAATLHLFFADQDATFDLTLLGLGADGHTASLFPENEPHQLLGRPDAPWVEAVTAPPRYSVRARVTLTLPALNRSRHVFFLVAGAEKRTALHAVLSATSPSLPAAHVQAQESLTWFVDQAAFGTENRA